MQRTWTEADGTAEVLTFKAGLLSAMGHDLLFRVERFELSLDGDRLSGWFDGTRLALVGAMKDGKLAPGVLSAKDERDILENIRKHVFKRHRVERIAFEADDLEIDEHAIEGEGALTIPPQRHEIRFHAEIDDDRAVCEVVLHQPDWGIAPFKALMGALKIQPDVRVRITVPWTS